MIILEEGKENTITIKVNASMDIAGFSLVLAACGILKTISDITAKNLKVVYSAADVAKTSPNGTYGTLIVYDANGKEYMKYLPLFARVKKVSGDETKDSQTINITIVDTKEVSKSSEGGDMPTPIGEYVTPAQLNQAINAAKTEANEYTDTALDEMETAIIQDQPVEVIDKDGEPMTITVKEAIQQVVEQQTTIEQAMESHIHGGVKDEDHDGQPDNETLYLNTGKDSLTI